jgi:DNA replication initiation complex subunit (GINS family)
MLDDEISNIDIMTQSIYERRQVKILKYAISASLGNDVETVSMIPDEVDMFNGILDDMRKGRRAMLERAISDCDNEPQCARSMGANPVPALAEPKTRTE